VGDILLAAFAKHSRMNTKPLHPFISLKNWLARLSQLLDGQLLRKAGDEATFFFTLQQKEI
jgi:hypothetical protein